MMLLFGVSAIGQLQVSVPQPRYKPHENIDVGVTNTSKMAVSFCVEFGHWSFRDADHFETTPTPVYVQRNNRGRWNTLLIGPDIGSIRHSVTVGPGESQHYPFRLSDQGQMRARAVLPPSAKISRRVKFPVLR
jgi:hypothetical protein